MKNVVFEGGNPLADVTCVDPTDYLETITANVQVAYEFFNPKSYEEDKKNSYAYDIQETGLNK